MWKTRKFTEVTRGTAVLLMFFVGCRDNTVTLPPQGEPPVRFLGTWTATSMGTDPFPVSFDGRLYTKIEFSLSQQLSTVRMEEGNPAKPSDGTTLSCLGSVYVYETASGFTTAVKENLSSCTGPWFDHTVTSTAGKLTMMWRGRLVTLEKK